MNIQTFNKKFPNNEACLAWLFEAKFGNPTCPKCHKLNKYHQQKGSSHFVCACGGHQLSPKINTIFQKSDTDLYKWFFAIYLFSASKNGVAGKELQRQLGVTYKTAWRMTKQIRHLMKQGNSMLSGVIDIDETYMGGKMRGGKRGLGSENKTAIFGMIERKGNVKAHVIRIKKNNVMPIVRKTVVTGSNLMTDQFRMYRRLPEMGFNHEAVNHGRKEYVRGSVHTNTIEGFWSQVKRSIDGTYHAVSKKHLQSYVDEFSFRRNEKNAVFEAMVGRI